MIPVNQIKKDLNYTRDLSVIIESLKLIASSEFAILSAKMPKKDPLKDEIITCFDILTNISKTHPFFVERKDGSNVYLMVCSDEGFAGEVNTLVTNTALARGAKRSSKFIVLGERGGRLLREAGVEFTLFPGVTSEIEIDIITKLSNHIIELYKKEKISSVYVVYMKFVSFTSHRIDTVKLLPCDELVGYIKDGEKKNLNVLIEPDPYYVLEYLVKLWIERSMYNIFWSSKLSEWAVRVMQLEHSSDELKEMSRELKFKYFKSVHALNDKTIREIFSARTLSRH